MTIKKRKIRKAAEKKLLENFKKLVSENFRKKESFRKRLRKKQKNNKYGP